MDILSALRALVTLESGLTITDPVAARITKAYVLAPSQASALPDTPCWINSFDLTRVEPVMAPSPSEQSYTIPLQLLVYDADLSQAALIATAFHVQLMAAWDDDPLLGGTVMDSRIRGGTPTLGRIEWAGQAYAGLSLYLDLELV